MIYERIKSFPSMIISLIFSFLMSVLLFAPSGAFAATQVLRFESTDTIEDLRAKITANGYNFTVSHNWVYDMTPEQKERFFSRKKPRRIKQSVTTEAFKSSGPVYRTDPPSQFDWRNYAGHTYIGPIRDQKDCGSCYAFSAAAAAECVYNIVMEKYDGNCIDFSEAHIAFCLSDYYDGFDGCSGSSYDYEELDALVNIGICEESYYTYPADPHPDIYGDPYDENCGVTDPPLKRFKSWHRIACNDISAIKTAIMTYGAVDAAVYATSAFQAYGGGIYEDSNTTCDSFPCYYTPTNHGVALVGWNDSGGYWILRNSWSEDWGENGYMRIKYSSAFVSCEVTYLEYSKLVAADDTIQTAANTPVTFSPTENDYDPEYKTITLYEISSASHGSAVLNPDKTVTYTPDAGFTGFDSFTYKINNVTYSATGNVTCLVGGICDTYFQSTDTPVAIPDDDLSGVTSVINASDYGIATDINVKVNITHTYDEDLSAFLTSPSGKTITLFMYVGGNGNNFANTILDDDATINISDGSAPFYGAYRPMESLGSFIGETIEGEWQLTVVDDWSMDTGTLNSWRLDFCRVLNSPQFDLTNAIAISKILARVGEGSLEHDADNNGKVDAKDLLIILQQIAEQREP